MPTAAASASGKYKGVLLRPKEVVADENQTSPVLTSEIRPEPRFETSPDGAPCKELMEPRKQLFA
jgi:hypothetical protein